MRRPAIILLLVALTAVAARASLSTAQPGPACGVEAWAVKTLSDPAARRVDLAPEESSVAALDALAPPAFRESRLPGAEMHVWRIHVRLLWQRLEDDSDIHLVVQDVRTRATLIAELPAPSCSGAAAAPLAEMASARTALARYCGPATARFATLHGTATVDGVAFFDRKHNQRGVAPNAIELHPVLRLSPGGAHC